MEALARFADSYFLILMPVFIALAGVQMFIYHRIGSRIEAGFRQSSSPIVKFRESGASGRRKQPFTFGGASRVLEVVVTDREFCLKGRWPLFTAFGRQFGLTHLVPLSNIKSITISGHRVEVSLVDESGRSCVLELQLKEPRAFQQAASYVA